MRLRKRDLKPYKYYRCETVKEADGTTYTDWVEQGILEANIQPAGGKLMAEMYGERLAYMLVGYAPANESINESDAVCVFTNDKPDYRIVAVRGWSHIVFDLEKIRE